MPGLTAQNKRLIALILGLALAITVILVAATRGLALPGVPSGAVAIVDDVDDGTITDADYDRAVEQAASRQGIEELPEVGTPEYQQINNDAMQGLIVEIWVEGEAADRGIEVTDTDIQDELTQIRDSFQNEKEFARVVEQSKFCTDEEIESDVPPIECADVVAQGRLLALQRKLSDAFASDPTVTDAEIEEFYDANPEAFTTPGSRSVRVILNEDQATVEEAKAELEGLTPASEGFADAWKSAAKKYSQDQASKDRGGLLESVVEGEGDPQLDGQLFSAAEGELVGPFETDRGFYLIQVVAITAETTQPLDEVRDTIRQQLTAARQQGEQTETQEDFVAKWTRRTICDPDFSMELCSGYIAPEPEPVPGLPAAPEPPPVQSSSPIAPGTAALSIDGSIQPGLPQGPRAAVPADAPPQGLPPGAVPVGPGGAPTP